ncbi:glutathione S-transferase [Lentinula edodes]|uniref:Glutathione S-transferase n=1 Tax=Lentinula edodes TaxID=5353 RepID=A0A1Q3EJ76_LENED|nr:glutathione S-transferase [Lentinula edodes]
MTENVIVFYDIPLAEPNICWSPNTWKTRYSLNFKGLAYRTEWIEYPDIEALCIKIGAAPTDVKADGTTPEYTLPVIFDPSTNKAISDSFNIAQYLDTTYPDTPRLIPPGTRALQSGFAQYVNLRVKSILGQEALYNVKIEEWAPQGEHRAREWKGLRRALISLDGHYREAKEETGGDFLCGVDPSFVDFALAGILQWSKHILGAESEEWNDILSWQEGKWANFMSRLERYAVVA